MAIKTILLLSGAFALGDAKSLMEANLDQLPAFNPDWRPMVNVFIICRRWLVRETALNRAQVSRCFRKLMLLSIKLT